MDVASAVPRARLRAAEEAKLRLPPRYRLFHGIRIMLQTKKTVQGVGGRTEAIALLKDGATQFFPPRVTRLAEELVEDIAEHNIRIVNRLVCETMSNAEWGESALGKLPDDIRKFRDRYVKIFTPSTGRTSGDQH